MYKIYFKNNTSRYCEVKIFISNSPNEYVITGEQSNHLILKLYIPYYIERPDNVYRKYTFVADQSKNFKEIVGATENDFKSYITVVVYPEKRQQFHQFQHSSSGLGSKGLKVETDFTDFGRNRRNKRMF